MPPRYAYWTILIDKGPTAFRARDKDELLPTLAQLRRTNPNVELKWFARGRLWDSREQEQIASLMPKPRRSPEWRPGGAHKDPRQRFKGGEGERDRPPRRRPHDRPQGSGDRPQGTEPRSPERKHNKPFRPGPGKPFRPGPGKGPSSWRGDRQRDFRGPDRNAGPKGSQSGDRDRQRRGPSRRGPDGRGPGGSRGPGRSGK